MILVIHAHPYPSRSRAGAALLASMREMPDLEVRSLYDLYPDFDIDAAVERAALERADLVVWMHPLYWYGVPALLKQWIDHVLGQIWVDGSPRLEGKDCLWVTTSDGTADSIAGYEAPLRKTAADCGMRWLVPFLAHGVRDASEEALHEAGTQLCIRLAAWAANNVRA
jgi:glutathione-regulated potassium-efflux system ancillary protein KefF